MENKKIEIYEVNSTDEFANLRKLWSDMLSKSRNRNIFLTWEWLYCWWKHYGDGKKLKILIFRRGEDIIGIAPLMLTRLKFLSLLNLDHLELLGSKYVASDFLDFITAQEDDEELLSRIKDYFKNEFTDWDVMSLHGILSDSFLNSRLLPTLKNEHLEYTTNATNICPYAHFPDSYEKYYNSLSPKLRRKIKKAKQDLKPHKTEFVCIKDSEELEKYFPEFLRLNLDRSEKKTISSPFLDARFSNFHREIMNIFLDVNFLRLYFLKIDGLPVAAYYIFAYDNRHYCYQTGFDGKYEKLNLGTALLNYCMEDAINRKCSGFEFLRGNAAYKLRWTPDIRYCNEVYIIKKSFKGYCLYFLKKAIQSLKNNIKRIFGSMPKSVGKFKFPLPCGERVRVRGNEAR